MSARWQWLRLRVTLRRAMTRGERETAVREVLDDYGQRRAAAQAKRRAELAHLQRELDEMGGRR